MKKRVSKRLLSIVLALMLIASLLPLSAITASAATLDSDSVGYDSHFSLLGNFTGDNWSATDTSKPINKAYEGTNGKYYIEVTAEANSQYYFALSNGSNRYAPETNHTDMGTIGLKGGYYADNSWGYYNTTSSKQTLWICISEDGDNGANEWYPWVWIEDHTSGGGDTSSKYYLWYNTSGTSENPANMSSKQAMVSDGNGGYYADITIPSAGANYWFVVNESSSSATSKMWTSNPTVTSTNSKVSACGSQEWSGYRVCRVSVTQANTPIRITLDSSKNVKISDAGSQPATEPTTSPSPSGKTYYVAGRFNGDTWYDGTSATPYEYTKVSDNLYKFETNKTLTELATERDGGSNNWYIRVSDGSTCYGPSAETNLPASLEGETNAVAISAGTGRSFFFQGTSDATVTFWIDDSNGMKFYFTLVGDTPEPTVPTEPTAPTEPVAEYTITVNSSENGSVSSNVSSAKAGDKVILTVTPESGYKLDTLSVKDSSGTTVKVTGNMFTMPASNVTVTATFAENVGVHNVDVYFKSASASVYVPSVALDNEAAVKMTRTAESYIGTNVSNSLKFYWFKATVSVDSSTNHTLTFTTKNTSVKASLTGAFAKNEYYFAVNNLMNDTQLVDLTDEPEYIRNYHHTATMMTKAVYDEGTLGYTWIDGEELELGTIIDGINGISGFSINSATLAQKLSAELSSVSATQTMLLDVNLDGQVDVNDATYMQYSLVA